MKCIFGRKYNVYSAHWLCAVRFLGSWKSLSFFTGILCLTGGEMATLMYHVYNTCSWSVFTGSYEGLCIGCISTKHLSLPLSAQTTKLSFLLTSTKHISYCLDESVARMFLHNPLCIYYNVQNSRKPSIKLFFKNLQFICYKLEHWEKKGILYQEALVGRYLEFQSTGGGGEMQEGQELRQA